MQYFYKFIFFIGISFSSFLFAAQSSFPIQGTWKILSFQIVGYPVMNETEAQTWIGKIVRFTDQTAILQAAGTQQVCQKLTYQTSMENAEGYFLVGYQVKPYRLGITQEEVQVIRTTCERDSWLGQEREFVMISDEQMLSNWDGVFFFFAKQSDNITLLSDTSSLKTLLITPQSVGLLNATSHFDEETLVNGLSAAYTMKKIVQTDDEGQVTQAHFEAHRQDKLAFLIYPDAERKKIASVRTFDNTVQAPAKAHLGMTYAEIFKDEQQPIDCEAGIEERSGQTLCSFKNMESIQYVFELPKDNQGNISPIDALKQAKLIEFIWLADPQLITETTEANPQGVSHDLLDIAQLITPVKVAPSPILVDPPPEKNKQEEVQKAYKTQDKRLNQLYGRLVQQLNRGTSKDTGNASLHLTQLINAQKQWIAYRDDNCHWHAGLAAEETAFTQCLTRMTHRRADEIEQVLQQIESK